MCGNGSLSAQGSAFEFDPAKSCANDKKHGIGFARAQGLWDDPDLLRTQAPAQGERRTIFLGQLGNRTWARLPPTVVARFA